MIKPRLLVGAYAFSPTLGSEFAQGWNYVQQMSARYEVTVLVGSSDGRMGHFKLLEHPAVHELAQRVTIVPIQPDAFCRVIKYLDVRCKLSWLFVLGLRRWHSLALHQAQAMHRQRPFDLAHQLGPVGFRNPGQLYRLGIPSYWGPIGGFQYIHLRLAWRSCKSYALLAAIRNLSTFMAARSLRLRRAVQGFHRLSFATQTNRDNFTALYGVDGPVLSDQATVLSGQIEWPEKSRQPGLEVVWCGSVDARKNISLLLDVAAHLMSLGIPVKIVVIGQGPLLERAMQRAQRQGLLNLNFTKQIPREAVRKHFERADVLCFTSLSEANTSTYFEALEVGCIPIALDLDGFSSNITDDIGFKVDTRMGWPAIVQRYAQHLTELAQDPDLRERYRARIGEQMGRYAWQTLAERHAQALAQLATPADHNE